MISALLLSLSFSVSEFPPTMIYFICGTPDSAKRVAIEQLWETPAAFPSDCRSLKGLGMPQQAAHILHIVDEVEIDGGRYLQIGKVRRNGREEGYSAGILDPYIV